MDPTASIALAAFLAIVVAIVALLARHSRAGTMAIVQLARDSGWADIRTSRFLGVRIRGLWNGYPVQLLRLPPRKGAPDRMLLTVRVQAPARVEITRRQHGVFTRPMTLFGPPLVDFPPAAQFWVRADEMSLVERLFASSIPAMLDRNLTGRHDLLRIGGDALTIRRACEWRPEQTAAIGREELELAKAVIDTLTLRP